MNVRGLKGVGRGAPFSARRSLRLGVRRPALSSPLSLSWNPFIGEAGGERGLFLCTAVLAIVRGRGDVGASGLGEPDGPAILPDARDGIRSLPLSGLGEPDARPLRCLLLRRLINLYRL